MLSGCGTTACATPADTSGGVLGPSGLPYNSAPSTSAPSDSKDKQLEAQADGGRVEVVQTRVMRTDLPKGERPQVVPEDVQLASVSLVDITNDTVAKVAKRTGYPESQVLLYLDNPEAQDDKLLRAFLFYGVGPVGKVFVNEPKERPEQHAAEESRTVVRTVTEVLAGGEAWLPGAAPDTFLAVRRPKDGGNGVQLTASTSPGGGVAVELGQAKLLKLVQVLVGLVFGRALRIPAFLGDKLEGVVDLGALARAGLVQLGGATTGRTQSSKPNLANAPRAEQVGEYPDEPSNSLEEKALAEWGYGGGREWRREQATTHDAFRAGYRAGRRDTVDVLDELHDAVAAPEKDADPRADAPMHKGWVYRECGGKQLEELTAAGWELMPHMVGQSSELPQGWAGGGGRARPCYVVRRERGDAVAVQLAQGKADAAALKALRSQVAPVLEAVLDAVSAGEHALEQAKRGKKPDWVALQEGLELMCMRVRREAGPLQRQAQEGQDGG